MTAYQQYNISPWLTPVRVVSTSNISGGTYSNGLLNNGVGATFVCASGVLTIDSVVVAQGDRVLLQNQSSALQNGIYVCTQAGAVGVSAILTRSADLHCNEQLLKGQYVTVGAGTVNAGAAFVLTEPLPAALGINSMTWTASPLNSALGTAAAKAASDNSQPNLASVEGTTVANSIAAFADTAGSIGDPTTTSTSGYGFTAATGNLTATAGNLIAGSSGHAGVVTSYPGTATKGSLILAGVANTGNTNTTISNDAMGQASVVNIPDPANAIGQFLVGATATPFVSGNFPQNSGTAGLMVDSGVSVSSVSSAITQLGQLYQVSVTLNTAAVVAAYATPQVLIAAVSGKAAIVHSATVYTASTGNTAFTTGVAPIIQYGTTVHGAGTIAVGTGFLTGDITAATSQIRTIGPAASTTYTGITNAAVTFSCTTAYGAGTGTSVTFTLVYELITATV